MIKTCCQEWKWSQQSLLYLSNNQIYRMQNFKGYGKFPLSVWCIPDKDAWHWQHKAALFIQDYQLLLVITNIALGSVMNFSETVPRTNINKILRGIYLCVGRIMYCDHFIYCLRHTEHCTISQSCLQLSIHLLQHLKRPYHCSIWVPILSACQKENLIKPMLLVLSNNKCTNIKTMIKKNCIKRQELFMYQSGQLFIMIWKLNSKPYVIERLLYKLYY